MARLVNLGKRRPSGRARQRKKRSSPIKYMVRCIEFSICLLVFGVLLLLVHDAILHPHSREAISIAIILRVVALLPGYLYTILRWLLAASSLAELA